MKHLFQTCIMILALSTTIMAQDASKDFKNAQKSISKLATAAVDNSAELTAAIEKLQMALKSEDVGSNSKNWISAGQAYNKLANEEFKTKTLDVTGQYKLAVPNSAILAFDAYAQAAKIDGDKKDIIYGVQESEGHLNNFAIFAYQEQDYGRAFNNFSKSIEAYDLLKSKGKESRLDEEGLLTDQYFFTAVSAYYNEQHDAAKPYLEKLYADGSQEAFVYDALYNIYAATDADKALTYLEKGREVAPDDTGLLFSEINHYLKSGDLDVLIGKLEMAIEKEPDNVSVYNTLGSVYDQLQQQSFKDGDKEKAQEYFDKAMENYTEVITRDENNFDATYSVGALYYNKAAAYVDKLNDLASDLSPAGMKAYDETKAQMDKLFEEALPHFNTAEALNGNDRNTLIALKEIHARLNNTEKSNEYKAKLEALGVSNQ